jgi:hypothetical protein
MAEGVSRVLAGCAERPYRDLPMVRAALALVAVVVGSSACALPPPAASPRPAGGVVSPRLGGYGEIEREQLRLHRLAEQRVRDMRERVERVGRRLLEKMPDPPRVQFVIAAGSREINAGATFGQVIVTSGLLDFVRNDDELAAVLGHELAHISEGHVTKGLIGSLAVNVLAIVVESQAPGLGNTAGGLGQLALNRYTQSQEREADRVGIEFMYRAGYDPRAAADVQERLAIEVPQTMTAGFFDTHPSSVERMVNARRQAEQLLAQGPPPGREEVLAAERRALAARPDRGADTVGFPAPVEELGPASRGPAQETPSTLPAGTAPPESPECRKAETYRLRADETSDPQEAEQLYRRALRYCPGLEAARRGLDRLGGAPSRGRGSSDGEPASASPSEVY